MRRNRAGLLGIEFHPTEPPGGSAVLMFSHGGALRPNRMLECELADLGPDDSGTGDVGEGAEIVGTGRLSDGPSNLSPLFAGRSEPKRSEGSGEGPGIACAHRNLSGPTMKRPFNRSPGLRLIECLALTRNRIWRIDPTSPRKERER